MRYLIAAVLCIATVMLTGGGCRLSVGGVEGPITDPIPDNDPLARSTWGNKWHGDTITNRRKEDRLYPIAVIRDGKPKKLLPSHREPRGEVIRITRREGVYLYFQVTPSGRLKYLPRYKESP